MKFSCDLTNNKQIICKELKVKDYKEILKCSFGDEPDLIIFLESVFEVLQKLTNTSISTFKEELHIVDLFCMLIDIRMNCLDNICKVTATGEKDKPINIDLHLEYVKEELLELNALVEQGIIEDSNFKIFFSFPTVERLMTKSEDFCLPFIKKILFTSNNKTTVLDIKTNKQAEMFLEKISPKTYLNVYNQCSFLLNEIKTHNFLECYNLQQRLSFIPNLETFLWFAKLIFSESLLDFYKNLFYLSFYGHMNTDYIEECTVGEYKLFTSELRGALNQKNDKNNSETPNDNFEEDDGFIENEE